ncbi:MAG: hypothetical protein ACOC46_04565 [Pirellulales bacterium]
MKRFLTALALGGAMLFTAAQAEAGHRGHHGWHGKPSHHCFERPSWHSRHHHYRHHYKPSRHWKPPHHRHYRHYRHYGHHRGSAVHFGRGGFSLHLGF